MLKIYRVASSTDHKQVQIHKGGACKLDHECASSPALSRSVSSMLARLKATLRRYCIDGLFSALARF